MIGTLARKSLRARLGRNIFIGLAIMLGVSFVVASFVVTDSLRASFDQVVEDIEGEIDIARAAERGSRPLASAQRCHVRSTHSAESTSTPSRSKSRAPHSNPAVVSTAPSFSQRLSPPNVSR